ncbi:hypothetical protein GN244_ATG02542 [Phytophthora infestans]|uniref:Uncharacterized protein n=1 Tax=Phytophthora infestans TaxID=4787 RepID=A0A833T881_PHYIN|nr:hypothetical protein GN244_ATG02542 [Phytophthora infestans]KAF4149966.1 hypothetical protein GN958_ATG00905 [Phytophthora infestans]
MEKHGRAATNNQASESPPRKVAKVISVCDYCDKQFTARGLSMHQKKCAKKQECDKAAAKKTRSYRFSFINEAIHEEILSFLNNQTLTKMQMITGDHFQQCNSSLARYCCKCENDSPVVRHSLCRQCLSDSKHQFNGRIAKRCAKDKFGMREVHFNSIDKPDTYPYYSCKTLEDYMLSTFGSKKEWLLQIAKVDIRKKKTRSTRRQNRERKYALKRAALGFAAFVRAIGFKGADEEVLEKCKQRFVVLEAKLEERGLFLRDDSVPCKIFVTTGHGSVEAVVDAVAGTA